MLDRPIIEHLELRVLLQGVTFVPHVDYGTGTDAQGIATADFNGDGIPDIVVANKGDNDISVFMGNGDGTFAPNHNYYTAYYPVAVAAADLTGDGHDDIIVANNTSNSVSVLLNNGDGTFQNHVDYGVGTHPEGIAVADINGDGKQDIVAANFVDNTVSILLGNGDGTFQPQEVLPVGNGPSSVAVADLAGNGREDIITSDLNSHSITILMGNGDGTFKAPLTYNVGTDPESVVVGDLTHNGILDIVTANIRGDTVSVLMGNGNGTFKPAMSFPTGTGPYCAPDSVTIADINSDGIPDLVTADGGFNYAIGNAVAILPGNGDGTFGPPEFYTVGNQPTGVVAADFNGDGKDDIASSNGYDGSFSALVNNTPGVVFSPSINQSGSTLFITGTSQPDTARLHVNNSDSLVVKVDGLRELFPAPSISQVQMSMGGGDDSVFIGKGAPSTIVRGGGGDDTIIAINSASDTLASNKGHDSIEAMNGNDLLKASHGLDTLNTIVAGSGPDSILASGADMLEDTVAGYDHVSTT